MIKNQWYAILPASQVRAGEVLSVKRLGKNLALFRTETGGLGCVTDQCAHRGAAIGKGWVQGDCVCCPFHGLQYDATGTCRLVPALGKATKADLGRFHLLHYAVQEAHGIIYLWNGDAALATDALPFFTNELDDSILYSEIEDHWQAFYSRCIENQLDVVHLPFVHHNTIGRGNKTLVNGPKVLFENNILLTGNQNEVDVGQTPKPAAECTIGTTYLSFLFPNLWMNHISDTMRVVIFFAPVDARNTVLYIRYYSNLPLPRSVNRAVAFLGKFGNRIIERQDKRVVITQKPKISSYRSNEKLIAGDGPIILYRRLREEKKQLADTASKTKMP